jgi:hypothetical protein
MNASAIDDAQVRLVQLRHDEWGQFGLSAASAATALALTYLYRPLALPFLVGAGCILAVGARTLWLRWDLVERLSGERDAYAIPEVFAFAARASDIEQRRWYAALIRSWLTQPPPGCERRFAAYADELEALARELEDDEVDLGTAPGVACKRLLTDPSLSALLNPALPAEDLRARISQIRAGFDVQHKDHKGGTR